MFKPYHDCNPHCQVPLTLWYYTGKGAVNDYWEIAMVDNFGHLYSISYTN